MAGFTFCDTLKTCPERGITQKYGDSQSFPLAVLLQRRIESIGDGWRELGAIARPKIIQSRDPADLPACTTGTD